MRLVAVFPLQIRSYFLSRLPNQEEITNFVCGDSPLPEEINLFTLDPQQSLLFRESNDVGERQIAFDGELALSDHLLKYGGFVGSGISLGCMTFQDSNRRLQQGVED